VIIATRGRPQLARALCSIHLQTLPPSRVIISVDARDARRLAVERAVRARASRLEIEVCRNDRSKGAAGAWNTALCRLLRRCNNPESTLVSFLDDDDAWEPTHLAEVDAAMARGAEVVATSVVRYELPAPAAGLEHHPPARLVPGDFLRGNPGIQGSNLSARLSALLEAGMFDEALKSCTDRDLCIRLADLGVRYEGVHAGGVHHDARRRGRLSTPGSTDKLAGLDAFYAKYAWRMREGEEEAYLTRARALFGWAPPPIPTARRDDERTTRTTDRMEWIVAMIVDAHEPAAATALVDDLARLAAHPRVTALRLVLLQNGPSDGLVGVLDRARALGLTAHVIDEVESARAGRALGLAPHEQQGRMSIAAARSVLQQITYEHARRLVRPVVWITDDDLRLPARLDLFVDDVARARAAGLSAAIGMVAGSPPVPAATTLRTQLVDLVSFLHAASTHGADEALPDADRFNARWKLGRRDYYYDLVRRETDRLETPFLPRTRAAQVGDAVAEIVRRAPRILAGEQVFRPVELAPGDPLAGVERRPSNEAPAEAPMLVRGGNTFVFDVDLLRDVPNLSPCLAGRRLRRSDTLWALLARHHLGRALEMVPIVVDHDRSHDRPQGLDADKMFDDILGYAFSRAFDEHLRWAHRSGATFGVGGEARARIKKRTAKLARERMAELRISCFRVRGLAQTLDRLLEAPDAVPRLREEERAILQTLTATLRIELSDAAFLDLKRRVDERSDDPGFDAYFDVVEASFRVAAARRCCEERLRRPVDELLGAGAEGVVFRIGDRTAKVFDRWTAEDRAAALGTLLRLKEAPAPGAIPGVLAVHHAEDPIVLEMEWAPSAPYAGGRGPELVAFLRALRAAGWTCSNLHPRNLRVTAAGLRLVDVGRSLSPISPDAEERALRRALLSMRHATRADLGDLMRRSIDDDALPELEGLPQLRDAVREDDAKARLDAAVQRAAARHRPRSVLDFGCGKPRGLDRSLGAASFAAFDVDTTLAARWAETAPAASFLDHAALERRLELGPQVDLLLCSLVLCCVDDGAMERTLRRLRRLVGHDGAALVAVCDPRALHVEHTVRHRRHCPQGARYGRSAPYVKQVLGAGSRIEHHRPLSAYRRAFVSAGFTVVDENRIEGVDTEQLVPAPEFVLFELHPRSRPSASSRNPLPPGLSGLTVLSYHRVADERGPDPAVPLHRARGMVVSQRSFEAQMRALKRLFTPVDLEQLHRAARGQEALPHRAAWVTFDDGYRDIADRVAPTLDHERIPATFFLRAPLDDGLPSWAPLDLCYQVLARSSAADPRALLPLGEARERLLSGSYLDQLRWVLALAARQGVDPGVLRRDDLYLSARMIDDLTRSTRFSLGAHGTDHLRWTGLDDPALDRALNDSMDWLDRRQRGAPRCVAYPDAAFDPRIERAARRAGFSLGVVLEAAVPGAEEPQLALTRRIAADDERWVEALAAEQEER
jgi:peptidoglycan/xylan/chitin deacetylase (PgdA/CDA1 family)/GT2 family glycosyltransferase